MAKICEICKRKIGIMTGKVKFLDGVVCTKCYEQAGYGTGWNDADQMLRMRSVSIKQWRANVIYKEFSDSLAEYDSLIEGLQEKANPDSIDESPKGDEADQLKKFKELLDMGIITQEEFDAKKKQLLGL